MCIHRIASQTRNNVTPQPQEFSQEFSVFQNISLHKWLQVKIKITKITQKKQISNNNFRNWQTPTLMNFPMYLVLYLLTTIYINYNIYKISNKNLNIGYWICYFDCTLSNHDKNNNKKILLESRSLSKLPHYYYILGSIADVEGNTLLLFAYQFTTITSVSLLDFFSIAVVVVLAIVIFGRKYKRNHYLAILLCLIGIIILVISDKVSTNTKNDNTNDNDNHGSNPILGDILTLVGATCYGFSNTFEEYAVTYENENGNIEKNRSVQNNNNSDSIDDSSDNSSDRNEENSELRNVGNVGNVGKVEISAVVFYLRAIGYFGSIICLIQGICLEYSKLINENIFSIETSFYYFGYLFCLILYYILIPILLQYSTAVVMNLSLLTADIWSLLAGIILFKVKLNWLYFVAFCCIIWGVLWYNSLMYIHNYHNKSKIGHEWIEEDSQTNSVSDLKLNKENDNLTCGGVQSQNMNDLSADDSNDSNDNIQSSSLI